MFPIRKRKTTTYKSAPAKVPKIQITMPAHGRIYKRKSYPYKRKTRYNKRSSSGGIFKPRSDIPQIKEKRWNWLKVGINVANGGVSTTTYTVADIATAAANQLGASGNPANTVQRLMISSVQVWASAGVEAELCNPKLELKTRCLTHGTPAATNVAVQKDEGTLQNPAACGYKWSQLDAGAIHIYDSTTQVFEMHATRCKQATAQVMIKYYAD